MHVVKEEKKELKILVSLIEQITRVTGQTLLKREFPQPVSDLGSLEKKACLPAG